ncbi:MAG: helix-turn-helix transcriptional regulator [Bacteroidales bacterium]|nr:helix-turn-helix transcriptional regulator [Bacteroidales bacterium]
MISKLLNPYEIAEQIANNLRKLRLHENITQEDLARKSGVSLGSLKRFENSYEISLKNLIQLAITLDATDEFLNLLKKDSQLSIDDILKEKKLKNKTRKRASKND